MATLTITQGSKEGAYKGDDGTYAATLVSCREVGKGGYRDEGAPPFPSKDDGKPDYYLREWAFAIEDAGDDCMVWAKSSLLASPKSKAFGYIVALFGGKAPPVGHIFDIEKDLVGRMALVAIQRNPEGYVDVTSITALPKAMQKGAAKPAPVPVADADPDDLPF